MISIILSIIFIATCWKLGAWKRWREFYQTILYLIIGNFVYVAVFEDYRLWLYHGFLSHTIIGFIIVFLIYPPATMLFLDNFPSSDYLKKFLYILGWSVLGTVFEAIALLTGGITYAHGWNLLASFILFLGAFALIRLHYKKPLLVWPISLLCGIATTLIFGLPPMN